MQPPDVLGGKEGIMPQRPNVLVILLDTARAQNFSCYGYERTTTPHIDAIAAEGVRYDQAIATGCWSLPSQMSLLTGLFPSKHGAHELRLSHPHDYPMLPEMLQAAGYSTLGVSPNSWMSDEFGATYGFDRYLKLWQYWHTLPAAAAARSRCLARWAHGANRFYARHVFPKRNRARHISRHVCKLLETASEPFFMYAIYWDMHLPYTPRGPHATRWLPRGVGAGHARQVNRNFLAYLTGLTPMTAADFDTLLACYDGALASIDDEIGALVAMLRQRGLLDRTLLFITSDHGENVGDHGLMSHAYSLHDTLIRVPLIVRYPDAFPRGEEIASQVQLTDIVPTVLDVLQLDRPDVRQELQGLSLIAPREAHEERLAYAEMLAPHPSVPAMNRRLGLPENTPRPAYDRALRCVRTATTKFIWGSDGRHALYDLSADPGERHNRYAVEPERAAAMAEMLMAWQPPSGIPLAAPVSKLAPEVRQRLRDLGYFD
jgi:arylsulfatase A-like enzyme